MLHKQECVKFSGLKSSKFKSKNFLAQFQNCVMHLELDEVKLTLLKSYLSDYALQVASHLTLKKCGYRPPQKRIPEWESNYKWNIQSDYHI